MATYSTTDSFPGYDAINTGIKNGTMKIVNLYPISVVRNGQWAIDYSDTPGNAWNWEDYSYGPSAPTRVLKQGNTVYNPTADWGIFDITQKVPSDEKDEFGNPLYYKDVPTGAV